MIQGYATNLCVFLHRITLLAVMGGESWCTIKDLNHIPSSQDWECGPSACTYVLIFLKCDRFFVCFYN